MNNQDRIELGRQLCERYAGHISEISDPDQARDAICAIMHYGVAEEIIPGFASVA